ncbi:YbjN domain-containing protein [Deinococcus hopiensis]|uniref:Putative sensory transduction regulator n=1 Tax=Deinococcus hopiensis KR-140 TaxID=695939 RepID=A0A1W1UAU3_9DEIO|nr:YbjN domain-containing protein [Deinococcus hopiensis]SMB78216.1 Putative sensory transduction regulator [Deinococcus hopiensis KR-140]
MKSNALALFLSLTLLSSAHAVTADVLDAKPATLVKVLSEAGYKPTLRPGDAKTDPSIVLKVKDTTVYLYFDNCKNGLCSRVTASSGFEFPDDLAALPRTLATWNAEWYTQAYQQEDDGVYLDASYVLTGGYTKANFKAWFGDYLDELNDFADELY